MQMSHVNTLQDIANVLAYLQYHLYKVTKRQDNSETSINNTLSTLAATIHIASIKLSLSTFDSSDKVSSTTSYIGILFSSSLLYLHPPQAFLLSRLQ